MPFSAMVSGSTSTATSRRRRGTGFMLSASSTTYSAMKPCAPLMPRSVNLPVKQKS